MLGNVITAPSRRSQNLFTDFFLPENPTASQCRTASFLPFNRPRLLPLLHMWPSDCLACSLRRAPFFTPRWPLETQLSSISSLLLFGLSRSECLAQVKRNRRFLLTPPRGGRVLRMRGHDEERGAAEETRSPLSHLLQPG